MIITPHNHLILPWRSVRISISSKINRKACLDKILHFLAHSFQLLSHARDALLPNNMARRRVVMTPDSHNGVDGLGNKDLQMRRAERGIHGQDLGDGERPILG